MFSVLYIVHVTYPIMLIISFNWHHNKLINRIINGTDWFPGFLLQLLITLIRPIITFMGVLAAPKC